VNSRYLTPSQLAAVAKQFLVPQASWFKRVPYADILDNQKESQQGETSEKQADN